jgi:alginate O-acetyltransferase complex protein AlgI
MLFTSWAFVALFVVLLIALRLCRSRSSRQLSILAASIFFYGYWNPVYLLLLAAPSSVDYLCAQWISKTEDPRRRRAFLLISLVSNLSLLAYFKYTNFFIRTIATATGLPYHPLEILLPPGISFFTFKALSYTIDVYRREIPLCSSWWRFTMFITYFPELVAGPIVRASVFLPQMQRSLHFSWLRLQLGLEMILLGLTKKLLVADRLALFVDAVYANPSIYSPTTHLCAIIAYSLQIYCDFSGYSDMAIGISKIIGYDLPENFNMPYLATSVAEFWRRWHITLSQWLRDYLYIPLGGNRGTKGRTYLNLMLTMLLGGLWHGASWPFVFWGFLHGLALAVGKLWSDRPRPHRFSIPRPIAWLMTYSFVCICWVFFRASSFEAALIVLRKLFWIDRTGVAYWFTPLFLLIPLVIMAHYLGIEAAKQESYGRRHVTAPSILAGLYGTCRFAVRPHRISGLFVLLPPPGMVEGFALAAWMIGLYLFSSLNTSPFIYFQF